jgi:hypothetical protein
MKKLLSILGTIGLLVSSGNAVVACDLLGGGDAGDASASWAPIFVDGTDFTIPDDQDTDKKTA